MNTTKETNSINNQTEYKNSSNLSEFNEALFLKSYHESSVKITRIALVILAVLFASYGIIDFIVSPVATKWAWIIRYAMICPVIIAVFVLSYQKIFEKIMQPALSIMTLLAGAGTIGIIYISPGNGNTLLHFTGIVSLLVWAYTLSRMRFLYATAASIPLIIAANIVILSANKSAGVPLDFKLFLNNNILLISTTIIGMIVCFYIEQYERKIFTQEQMLNKKQDTIETEHKELLVRDEMNKLELEMAKEIQQQLIPTNTKEYIYSLYKPTDMVGGDFYDFISFRENHETGIFIGDVTGHGVSSALITSMIKSIIHESSYLKWNPADLLSHINDSLLHKTGGKFVTAFYCIYNHQTKQLKYANAGHYPPFVITKTKVSKLPIISSLPIAIYDNKEVQYKNMEMKLPDNSKLLLYTDGITDAASAGDSSKLFKDEIDDCLINNYESNSRDFAKAIHKEVLAFSGTDKLEDDICLICVDV